ncbi:MAG: 7-carboxy-7-deazaguanine synthase QueE [Gammaproteobacteria bacterium RIFCSPHIGHO2_12_FULL_38_14]|nr:MAG: 7-carboxy-7-deazaguanine synthase QueE [Gammaproteobacteria bacterium RIFCSPHIGHO2_12_FULL_38_14]
MNAYHTLRITEIFYSLQGESDRVGLPTVFVRLTGCPLRCSYCDTAYAFSGGKPLSIEEILREIKQYRTQYVTVTGGEPLAQPDCHVLLTVLCDTGYDVSLETSGALDLSGVDSRVTKIMDIKTPGSGESSKNDFRNINYLTASDQIKFVITDRKDYEWSKAIMSQFSLDEKYQVLLSPCFESITSKELSEWILADQLKVRFQVQLHKLIWGDTRGK